MSLEFGTGVADMGEISHIFDRLRVTAARYVNLVARLELLKDEIQGDAPRLAELAAQLDADDGKTIQDVVTELTTVETYAATLSTHYDLI